MQPAADSACSCGVLLQPCRHFKDNCLAEVCSHDIDLCPHSLDGQLLIRAPPTNDDDDGEDETTTTKTTKSPTPTATEDEEPTTTTKKEATTTTKKDDDETTDAETSTKPKPSSPTTTRQTTEQTTKESSTLITSPTTPLLPTAAPTLPTVTALPIPTPGMTTEIATTSLSDSSPTDNPSSAPAPVPSSPPAQGEQHSTTTAIAAGIGGTVTLAVIMFLLWWLIRKRRHSKRMSSVRGNSPLGFDDKIGTAEGRNATFPNVGGVLLGEAQSQHQTSINSNTTSSTRYGTAHTTDSNGGAPPAFRYGSLQNTRSHQGVSNQTGIPEEPSDLVVSPITPACDYGPPPLPPLPYGTATHGAAPADYGHGVIHAQRQATCGSHGSREPCGDRHDDQWPWNANSDDGYLRAQYPPNNYVSPMSPNFPTQQPPMPPMPPQPQYQAYRPRPSRTSSGGSNTNYNGVSTGHQHHGPRPPSRTPPPGSIGGQHPRNFAPQSLQPGPWSQSPNKQYRQQPSPPLPMSRPVQAIPRLVSVGSSGAGSSSSRRPSPAPEAELQGSEVPNTSMPSQTNERGNIPRKEIGASRVSSDQFAEAEDSSVARGTGVLQVVNIDHDIQQKADGDQSPPEHGHRDCQGQVTMSVANS